MEFTIVMHSCALPQRNDLRYVNACKTAGQAPRQQDGEDRKAKQVLEVIRSNASVLSNSKMRNLFHSAQEYNVFRALPKRKKKIHWVANLFVVD